MKKLGAKLYIPAILFIMTAGVFAMLKFGYKAEPEEIMKPSFFDRPEEIGAVVYRRFYGVLEEEKRVAFGVAPAPAWNQEIVRGFLQAAILEKRPYDVVIAEQQMPALNTNGLDGLQVVALPTNTEVQGELIEALQKYEGKRVLIYLPSIFSSHLLGPDPLNRFERTTGQHIMSITVTPLSLEHDQEYLIEPPCLGSERDMNNTSALGCHVLQTGRKFYPERMDVRKRVDQTRWVAIMNAPKPEDYVLMISTPGQDKGNTEANARLRMAPPDIGTSGD